MRFARIDIDGGIGVAVKTAETVRVLAGADLDTAVTGGQAGLDALYERVANEGVESDENNLIFIPPLGAFGQDHLLGS